MTTIKVKLKTILQNEFSWLLAVGILFCLFPLVNFEKGYSVLKINHLIANNKLDSFFQFFTELGHGIFFTAIIILQAFKSYKKAFQTALTGIFILIVSLFLKHIAFPDSPRPTNFLPTEAFDHLILNFNYARHFSFPSGHTMTAFGLAGILSFQYQNKYIRLSLFTYAALIGFSRMYLLQHFLIDVFTGAIIGYLISAITFSIFKRLNSIPEFGILKPKNAELS